jgi:DNA-binding response OmpR family regulator
VLVIDDDPSMRTLLTDLLTGDGLRVVAVPAGAGALEQAARVQPDLVLLDVALPDRSGPEVLARIRAPGCVPDVPVILLSALAAEGDKVRGLDAGADDYVTKPFGPLELRSRVRAALRRGRGVRVCGGPELLVADGLVLDLARRTVTEGSRPVALTFVEFELLRTLLAEPGRVFSRLQLLDGVWGSGHYRDRRTVDVHVRHLRQKLERDPAAPERISTVRGVGYRFS